MTVWLVATWLVLVIAAVACSLRWPVKREAWGRQVARHGAVALVLLVGAELFSQGFGELRRAGPPRVGAAETDRSRPPLPLGRAGGPPPFARRAVGVLLYALVASATHAVVAARRARARERQAVLAEARLAQAQLAALQMQLQPHFLFNALNGIAALMHSDLDAADRMLGDLSELLRMTLEAADEPEVPLRRELAYLDRYLAIEQARHGDRLTVERAVSSDVLDAFVPTLVLQPLVENAIKYGVEPVRAPGTVKVSAYRAGETLHLAVADTGSPTVAAERPAPGHGIGLGNTRARLAQLYPEAHTLTVEPGMPSGSLVRVTMPYRVAPHLRARGETT